MRIPARVVATVVIAASAAGGLTACGGDDTDADELPAPTGQRPEAAPDQSGVKNVVARIGEAPSLTSLERAIAQADLIGALQTRTSLTVFAPSDEAFASPEGAALLEPGSPAELRSALEDHVVAGRLPAARLTDGLELETLGGATLRVERAGGRITVDGVPVEDSDLSASNGVVHTVGEILDPAD